MFLRYINMKFTVLSAVLLVSLIFSCVQISEAKYTLKTGWIYSNWEDYVVIDQFAVDDFSIGVFNFGTLNDNSEDGVSILTSNSFTMQGANLNVPTSAVIQTTSSDSQINIDAAATLDVLGNTITFTSESDNLSFSAESDFELISTNDLGASFTGGFDITGVDVNFAAARGDIIFYTHSSIDSQATATRLEGSNLINVNTRNLTIEANFAVDIFAGYFEITVSEKNFNLKSQRNNILIESGTLLDVGGEETFVHAIDHFAATSLESRVVFGSKHNATYHALHSITVDSDSEITLNAKDADILIESEDTINMLANEGITIESTSVGTFPIYNSNLTVTGENIATAVTNGGATFLSNTFKSQTYAGSILTAEGDMTFESVDGTTLNADQGIQLYSAQTFSVAFDINDQLTPVSGSIVFDVTNDVTLGGSAVRVNVTSINLDTDGNFRAQTHSEQRDSQLNLAINSDFISTSNLFLLSGGDVKVQATEDITLTSQTSDIIMTATSRPASRIVYHSGVILDHATNDISYTAGEVQLGADDSIYYQGDNSLTLESQENILFDADSSVRFLVNSNITMTTTFDQLIESSSSINFGQNVQAGGDPTLSDFQVSAGFIDGVSSTLSFTSLTDIDISSDNLNFDAQDTLSISGQNSVVTAYRNLVFAGGDQVYSSSLDITFTADDIYFQSPPNQNLEFNAGADVTVNGDFTATGRNLNLFNDGDINIQTDNFDITTLHEDSLDINIGDQLQVTDSSTWTIYPDGDMGVDSASDIFISATTLNEYPSTDNIASAMGNIVIDANDTATFTQHDYVSYSSEAPTTFTIGTSTLFAADHLYYLSRGEDIHVTTSSSTFTGGDSFSVVAPNNIFNAFNEINFLQDTLEINGNLAIDTNTSISFQAGEEFRFFGSEFDFTSFGTLTLTATTSLTLASTDITFVAVNDLAISIPSGSINFNAGLHKRLYIYQDTPTSQATFSADSDIFFQSNDFMGIISHYSDLVATLQSSDTDTTTGTAWLLQSNKKEGGISFFTSTYSTTAFNTQIRTAEVTDHYGADIVLHATSDSTFITVGGVRPGIPASYLGQYPSSLTGGIYTWVGGSEYDPKLGFNLGVLYRTNSQSASNELQFTVGSDLIQNSKSNHDQVAQNSFTIDADSNVSFHTGRDTLMSFKSDHISTWTADNDVTMINGGKTHVSASGAITGTANDHIYMAATDGEFEVIAERGDIRFAMECTSGSGFTVSGDSLNMEGGEDATYTGIDDTINAAVNVVFFAFSSASFSAQGDGTIQADRNAYYESSHNNDITFNVVGDTTYNVDQDAYFTAGYDTNFLAGSDSQFQSGLDMTFLSFGNIEAVAVDTLSFISVLNQNIIGREHVYLESTGTIDIGDTLTPVVSIYAGGDALATGVDLHAVNFLFQSSEDVVINSANYYSRSSETTTHNADGPITIQATGTNGIGKDITFTAAESLDLSTQSSANMNAKTIKYEYNTLQFTADTAFDLTAVKGISYTADSFSSTSTQNHTLTTKTSLQISTDGPVDAAGQSSAAFSAGTNMITSAHTYYKMAAKEQFDSLCIPIDDSACTTTVAAEAANSPITFDTRGIDSFISFDVVSMTINAGDSIEYTLNGGFSTSATSINFDIGDSWTTSAEGSLYLIASGSSAMTITANNPSSSGSDVQFTSSGSFNGTIGQSIEGTIGGNLFFEPDADLTFIGGSRDLDSINFPPTVTNVNNIFNFEFSSDLSVTTTGDMIVNSRRSLIYTNTFDAVAIGVNPDDDNGVLISTPSSVGTIDIQTADGEIDINAADTIHLLSANGVSLNALGGTFNLHAADDIEFITTEVSSPIFFYSHLETLLAAEQNLNFLGIGDELGLGTIEVRAEGIRDIGNSTLLSNQTYGMGFFAENSNIDVQVDLGSFRMEDLKGIHVHPNENGTLLMQSFGQNEDGNGIIIESSTIAFFAELNVIFDANNVRFYETGIDPSAEFNEFYSYYQPFYLFGMATLESSTIMSQKDQTYVSYGHNEAGNAIEIPSNVALADIIFETEYVNVLSGGSVLINGEVGTEFQVGEMLISSASSVIFQADGIDRDIGMMFSTIPSVSRYDVNGITVGSNIEYLAEYDLYMHSADDTISRALEEINFITGEHGTIDIHFDNQGASFTSQRGSFTVVASEIDWHTQSNFDAKSNSLTIDSLDNIYVIAGATDIPYVDIFRDVNRPAGGNLNIGDPSFIPSYFGDYLGGGLGYGPNVYVEADFVYFDTEVVNVQNSNRLELPLIYNTSPDTICQNLNDDEGRTWLTILSYAPRDVYFFCQCVFSPHGVTPYHGPSFFPICVPFNDARYPYYSDRTIP